MISAPTRALHARRGRDEVADAADVDHEAVGRAAATVPRRRAIIGAPAESGSLRGEGSSGHLQQRRRERMADRDRERVGRVMSDVGTSSSPRIAFTIRCTCSLSARP